MLDRYATALMKPAVSRLARVLVRAGMKADQVTGVAFAMGFIAFVLIANSLYWMGATAIILSRILDALDGAVARQSQPTDRGAFLDIALDFLFYASIPLAFALADPTRNALAAAVLLAAFMGTSTIFLAFAVLAAKRGLRSAIYPDKSFYFLGGLTEATETLACFIAMCLWPQHFAVLAYVFSALCAATIATRLWWGWRTFS